MKRLHCEQNQSVAQGFFVRFWYVLACAPWAGYPFPLYWGARPAKAQPPCPLVPLVLPTSKEWNAVSLLWPFPLKQACVRPSSHVLGTRSGICQHTWLHHSQGLPLSLTPLTPLELCCQLPSMKRCDALALDACLCSCLLYAYLLSREFTSGGKMVWGGGTNRPLPALCRTHCARGYWTDILHQVYIEMRAVLYTQSNRWEHCTLTEYLSIAYVANLINEINIIIDFKLLWNNAFREL